MEQNRGLPRRPSGANPMLQVSGVGASQQHQQQQQQQQVSDNQMRQSNGFSTNSSGLTKMRISGQSFRPASRERNALLANESKLNEGESNSSNNSLYSLNILPLNQDEFTFASAIKADLIQLQEEITALDPDNRLRQNGNIDFGKGYQTALKKWLVANNESNIKTSFDRRMKAEIDTEKLCDALGQKGNPEEALKKLFRLCLISDFMSTKLTEFEMLSLMRFDESYSNLVKDDESQASGSTISKLKMIGGSGTYQFSKYQVCFANLERFANLIRSSKKLASRQVGEFMQGNDSEKVNLLERDMKELKETIRKRDSKIKELNEKIVDLTAKIEQQSESLTAAAKSNNNDAQKNLQKVIGKTPEQFKDNPEYWTKLIDETKEFYENKMREYESENVSLKEKLESQKIKTETIQDQLVDLNEKVNTLTKDKELLFANFSKRYASKEEAVNSYEDALKDEFDRMKKAFEKRIDTLAWDNERVKKEKARGLIDMKVKMDKEIETKSLLLKKLSCFIR